MHPIQIPNVGDVVQVFVQFNGDDAFDGPHTGVVRSVDIASRSLPELTVDLEFCVLPRVAYGRGSPAYWLPLPTPAGADT